MHAVNDFSISGVDIARDILYKAKSLDLTNQKDRNRNIENNVQYTTMKGSILQGQNPLI